jgi:hypothetical protein
MEGISSTSRELDAFLALAHGPRAAAWLVRRFRRSLKQFGVFFVEVDHGQAVPRWFRLAIATLRSPTHCHVWKVFSVHRIGRGGSRYVVRWLLWPRLDRRVAQRRS